MFITAGGVPGTATTADFEDDLDMETADAWGFGLAIAYDRHRVHAVWEPLEWHGRAVLSSPLVYHAVTFGAGETVDSDVEMSFLRFGYDYALLHQANANLRAGLGGVWWMFDATLDGSVSGSTRREFTHLYPSVHAEGEAYLGAFHLHARAAYATLLESDRYLLDLEAAVGVRLFGCVTLDVGWRYWRLEFHETTNIADFTATGPFAEVSIDI
jgi:hypothetical protein